MPGGSEGGEEAVAVEPPAAGDNVQESQQLEDAEAPGTRASPDEEAPPTSSDSGSPFASEYDSFLAQQLQQNVASSALQRASPAAEDGETSPRVSSPAAAAAAVPAEESGGPTEAGTEAGDAVTAPGPSQQEAAAPAPGPPPPDGPASPPSSAAAGQGEEAAAGQAQAQRAPAPRLRELDDAFSTTLSSETARALLSPSLSSAWAAPQARGRAGDAPEARERRGPEALSPLPWA